MMTCVFCGRVPDKLPHFCLLEKRQREEDALLQQAIADEQRERERSELRRALVNAAALEQRYAGLVADAERKTREAAAAEVAASR